MTEPIYTLSLNHSSGLNQQSENDIKSSTRYPYHSVPTEGIASRAIRFNSLLLDITLGKSLTPFALWL